MDMGYQYSLVWTLICIIDGVTDECAVTGGNDIFRFCCGDSNNDNYMIKPGQKRLIKATVVMRQKLKALTHRNKQQSVFKIGKLE